MSDSAHLELYPAAGDEQRVATQRRALVLRVVRFLAAQQLQDLAAERAEVKAMLRHAERELRQ